MLNDTGSKLFLPSARATNWLLIAGFSALGYALYLRYLVIEQSSVGLACQAGLNTWLCATRGVVATLFGHSIFGIGAIVIAAVNLLRPSLVLLGAGIVLAAFGIVLYNINTAGVAIALLALSLARRAPTPE